MSVTCGEGPAHAVRVLRGGLPEGQLDDEHFQPAVAQDCLLDVLLML
jgi:hypothetical protein